MASEQSSAEGQSPKSTIDVLLEMTPQDIKSKVENKKLKIENLPQMFYDLANDWNMNLAKKERFEAIVDGLLKRKDTLSLKSEELIKLLTSKHKVKENSFTVLSLAFKLRVGNIIKKLIDLLTFEIDDDESPKKWGVIVNGLIPITLKGLQANMETLEDGNSCLQNLVDREGNGNGDDFIDIDNKIDEQIAEVLDIEPIGKVESVYNRMTTLVYTVIIVLHTVYMTIFSIVSITLMEDIRNRTVVDPTNEQATVFYFFLPLEPGVFIIYYGISVCSGFPNICKNCKCIPKYVRYKKFWYVIWEWSPMVLRLVFTVLIITSIMQFSFNQDVHNTLSVTLLVGWLTTLTFTEGVATLRVFWKMIIKMIAVDVYKIIIVYAFVLLSFSLSLHIQFQQSQDLIDEYPTPLDTMFLVYELMLGNGELFTGKFQNSMKEKGSVAVSKLLYVGNSIIATLVLMNLLIAMMNTSYEEVMKELRLSRRITSLKRALSLEKFVWKICCRSSRCLVIFWKIIFKCDMTFQYAIKKGTLEPFKIKEKPKQHVGLTTFLYVEVTGPKEMCSAPSEDGVVKLIQELKNEMNWKLSQLRDDVARTYTKIEREHTKL